MVETPPFFEIYRIGNALRMKYNHRIEGSYLLSAMADKRSFTLFAVSLISCCNSPNDLI